MGKLLGRVRQVDIDPDGVQEHHAADTAIYGVWRVRALAEPKMPPVAVGHPGNTVQHVVELRAVVQLLLERLFALAPAERKAARDPELLRLVDLLSLKEELARELVGIKFE